jgi:Spy/CpxP family protein refolding chaperone
MNKSKLKISAFLLLIFLAGALSGGAIVWKRTTMHSGFPRPEGKGPGFKWPTPDEMANFIMNDWKEKLDLSDQQVEQIKPLVQSGIETVRQIQIKSVEQVREIMSKGDAKVSEFLTPDQKVKFEEMQKERFKFGPGRGGPHGPDGRHGPPGMPPPPDHTIKKRGEAPNGLAPATAPDSAASTNSVN